MAESRSEDKQLRFNPCAPNHVFFFLSRREEEHINSYKLTESYEWMDELHVNRIRK